MFWYDEEVKRLELERSNRQSNAGMVFYGSSSIRMWNSLTVDFAQFHPINAGFGGSTFAACSWFFERTVAPLQPTSLVLYAGDNDLGDGRHPEEVFLFFKQLVLQIEQKFGSIPVAFLSIKPSLTRWNIIDQITYTNKIIKNEIEKNHPTICYIDIFTQMMDEFGFPKREFYMHDGLHINEKGYALWKKLLLQAIIDKKFNV